MKYEEFYVIANKITSIFYKKFKREYKQYSYDEEDLRQEAQMYMWKAIKKYEDKKPYTELKKLAMAGAYFRLRKMLSMAVRSKEAFTKLVDLGNSDGDSYQEAEIFGLLLPEKELEHSIIWLAVRDKCTLVDYNILDMKINKNISFDQIGRNLFKDKIVTPQYVHEKYQKIIKTLKNYLIKSGF